MMRESNPYTHDSCVLQTYKCTANLLAYQSVYGKALSHANASPGVNCAAQLLGYHITPAAQSYSSMGNECSECSQGELKRVI